MMCDYRGCLKQLGTCPECKAPHSMADVNDAVVDMIERAGFDEQTKRILSPSVTNMIGKLFIASKANAVVSLDESDDEPELVPMRPAQRLVHVNPDGVSIGHTVEVISAADQPCIDLRTDDPSTWTLVKGAMTRWRAGSATSTFPLGSPAGRSTTESTWLSSTENQGRACELARGPCRNH